MKKFLALAGVAAIGVVAPATVGASTKEYAGSFETSGTIGFKVESKQGKKKVIRLRFASFPLDCDGGPNTATGNVPEFKIKVNDSGKFDADLISEGTGTKAELNIDGKLMGGGN